MKKLITIRSLWSCFIAVAMFMASQSAWAGFSASTQIESKPSVVPQAKSKVVNKPQTQRSFQIVAPREDLKSRRNALIGSKLTLDPAKVKPVTHAESKFAKMSAVQNVNKAQNRSVENRIDREYNAHGMDFFEGKTVSWTMQRGTRVTDDEETHFFVNMTPMLDILSEIYPNGIDVEYTQVGNTITVKPQVIASINADDGSDAKYIMLCSGTSEDGSIVLTEGENGAGTLKVDNDETIIIGAWSTKEFDSSWETYRGSYSYIGNISYRLPGELAEAPKNVSFEPNELVLFAGLSYSGYGYNDNLAMMGAFAPTTFRNTTTDIATGFDWSVVEKEKNGGQSTITSNDRNFTLNTKGDFTYEDFKLTAYNEGTVSEPYTWGIGHCPNNEGTGPRYGAVHVYAGQGVSAFGFTDGSYAVMTRQNPDGDLTFYTNWGTPDIYERASISTIYSYQGKPSTPLYITGVTLPLVSFEAKNNFNLHIKLCKCTRDSKGELTLGDVIAEGDATLENVNDDYDRGITAVEFTKLYVEDEFGMNKTMDYLFIEDEFVVIIEGWDNGTFSGVLGSQNIDVSNLPSTWFTETGEEEGTRHYYTSWFPQLFIGFLDATYGYLYTEDETDLLFAKEGGQSSIHIDPMYYTTNENTGEPTYSLAVESIFEDGEEVDEMPDWVSFEVANEDYTTAVGIDSSGDEYEYFINGIDYDLVINVEPLPKNVENRKCQVVFFQTGAKIAVTITQNVDGHEPQYTITFDTNGGSPIEAITQDYGSTITPPEAPTREGYTFLGWEPAIPETMPLGGLTVVAQWQINSYTLTYKVDDEVYKTFEVEYGSTITPEAAPTKEGYTFSGWSEIPETMPANDVVVTGSFTVNKYNLTYKVDGEVYKTYEVAFGSEIIPEPAPTKEGHTFGGWSEIPATMPAHDVEVTGSFTVNSYFLFYVLDGSVYKAYGVQYGSEIVPEADPEKEGYTFSGWEGLPETMPAYDVTVQGSFTINSYTLTYLVDGEEYKTETLVYGTEITPEAEPTKEGYTFSGWSEIPETMPAQDVTVTGSFTVNSYTLSYIVDGEVYKTFKVEYGSTITPEAEPMRAGYTFSGWSEIPETMPANDVEVTGSFILKMAESIALDMESLLFNSTDAQQLNVTLTPSDLINNTISWSSTDIEVATVDETGLVTPVGNGEAYIIACTTDGTELKDSCMVTVDFKAATLAIDKESVKFTKLKRKKLTAIVTPDKASQEVTWSSSDASIVTVSETGTITPLRNGKAIITATTTDGTELSATCTVTVSIPSQFEVAVTQTTFTIQSNSETSEAMNIKATIDGEEYDLGDEGKLTGLAPGRTYHVEVNADIDGYNWTEELDVTMAEIAVNFEGKTSPTTLDISAAYDAGDATVTSASFEGEENVSSLNLIGLEPAQTYSFTYSINTEEGGTYTYETQFTTETLALNISRTKVVSVGNVVVVASSNITEEENVSVGFEWRRYDWPDEIQTKTGAAYIYAGTIEGSIKNLNADKFWKIRPYFLSQAGNRFLGDWVTIDPSDVSYFEPSVHTYNSISVEGNTAEVKGFVMQGSDDVESQGFMYWENTPSSSSRRNANGVPVDAKIVKANGNMMVASLEDLEFETNYCYVAFAKTSEGEVFYGEQQTFTTGEMDPDGIESLTPDPSPVGEESWYDLSGRKIVNGKLSNGKLPRGINIIRYADGTTKKVLIK